MLTSHSLIYMPVIKRRNGVTMQIEERFEVLFKEVQSIKESVVNIDRRIKKIESYVYKCKIDNVEDEKNGAYYIDKNRIHILTGDIWNETIKLLKDELTEISFNTWIKIIRFEGITDKTVYLTAPSTFYKDILEQRYSAIIQKALFNVTGEKYEIQFNFAISDEENDE